jgi:hypothetical protein
MSGSGIVVVLPYALRMWERYAHKKRALMRAEPGKIISSQTRGLTPRVHDEEQLLQGCFSFLAARMPWLVASCSHIYAPAFVLPYSLWPVK